MNTLCYNGFRINAIFDLVSYTCKGKISPKANLYTGEHWYEERCLDCPYFKKNKK